MQVHVLRLQPGEDLRGALEAAFRALHAEGVGAACVLSAVGSLSCAVLRYADQAAGTSWVTPLELLSLSGTLSVDGPHLHASVADGQGRVRGGHVMRGCVVRTTAEVVLALLPGWQFSREADVSTGFQELVVRRLDPVE
ncbi:PPC domain-containing DNA-binding protein [Polaromonas sp. SM01]|uniref:PPC domain-containing DNA-binding protein n=1 Tax=Polaromonas sp. SM01 TaxID=3085630 RepID=UPI0029828C62|nr:PPC domain-containing DNA-binding protein [Polaromonas sp. SM01]MDW5441259.1 DNA-binding protein [Polaromonas sp. SM01]